MGTLADLTRNPDLAGFVMLDIGPQGGACVLFTKHNTTVSEKKNPKKTVQLLCKRVTPNRLREVMERKLKFEKDLEEDVKGFIKALCTEAASCQTYVVKEKPNHCRPRHSAKQNLQNSEEKPKSNKKEPPICLLPKHKAKGIRHWVKHCTECSVEPVKKLKQEYEEEAK